MMNENKGAIGIREFVAIIFLVIGLKHTDLTPTILYNKGTNSTWIMIFFAGIFTLIPLLVLFHVLKKYKNKNLMELIYYLFGKYFGFAIGVILLAIGFIATTIDSRSYADIISVLYFRQTPTIVIYFVFLGSAYFIAKRGLQVIGRVAVIMAPIVIIVTIVIFILIYKDLILDRFYPILGIGVMPLIKQGFLKSSIFGELFMLTLLYTYLRNGKSFRYGTYIGLGTTWFVLIAFYIVYEDLFSYPTVEKLTYPFHEVIRYIDITPALTNNEIFFFAFWLYSAIIRFSVYLYLLANAFGSVFHIKEFEPLILPLAFVSLTVGMMPENAVQYALIFRDQYLLNPTSISFTILPFLMWAAVKWKGDPES